MSYAQVKNLSQYDFSKEAVLSAFLRKLTRARKPLKDGFSGSKTMYKKSPLPRNSKVPKSFAESIDAPSAEKAWAGYKEQAMQAGGGAESLLLFPAQFAAEKILGKHKVKNFMWNHVGAPALKADVATGKVLEKMPLVGKKLFRVKEKIPWGKNMQREVERSSALGPLIKARDIAEPLIVGVGLERGLTHLTKKKDHEGQTSMKDQQLREKVASVMLHLHEKNKEHEKRAHALRVLYKQVELGYGQLPHSFSELSEKLAALANEDLCVLEKALELAGGNLKLGELDQKDSSSTMSPTEKFQAAILD